MKKINTYGLALLVLITIIFVGYYFIVNKTLHSENSNPRDIYTCSMHPEISSNKPGNCPICGMTLVKKINKNHTDHVDKSKAYTCPMSQDSVFSDTTGKCPKCGMDLIINTNQILTTHEENIDHLLKPTDHFIVGNYETTTAIDSTISNEINLPGIITYDLNSAVNISARVSGRIEKLYINYKYQQVSIGQKLFELYSPELLTEQQNFIYLISNDDQNTAIVKASKQKLLLFGMSENQINALKISKKANPIISIYSPATGIISGTEKMELPNNSVMQNSSNITETLNQKEGSYINKGEIVFKLLNTNKVWGIFNISQGNNNFVRVGQAIKITTEFDAMILAQVNFLETQLNSSEKTNSIRVYLNNAAKKLPIGLRVQGKIKMPPSKGIWLQKQAFVSVGTKKIVFLKMNNGFMAKAIKTGMETSDYIQVLEGISVKDSIAKNAQYLTDSESFIKAE